MRDEIIPPGFSQIEDGPETDLLVAQACGMEAYMSQNGFCYRAGFPCDPFRPTQSWGNAMLASEEFGLLGEEECYLAYNEGVREYRIRRYAGDSVVSGHESGPLAISRAILILRSRKG